MATGKGLIRSLDRKGARSDKKPRVALKDEPRRSPTICERCGAVFARRTWRRGARVGHAALARAAWTVCPACRQVSRGEGFGRVLLRGAWIAPNADAIRRRIQNVGARAGVTQPERRIVSVDAGPDGMDVLTTSQKLAHRIVAELKKAFGGRASYAWSDRDGSLFATWTRDATR